jgi:Cu-Zn family superoxide dismutase
MRRTNSSRLAALALTLGVTLSAAPALAASVVVPLALTTPTGVGEGVGTITLSDGAKGVTMALDLHGLPPGEHGFHLHANPSCEPVTGPDGKLTPAGAAGAHLDPAMSKMHMGPDGVGHLGDLPKVEVGADGTANQTLAVTRLKTVEAFKGHALMLHAGGDTYSDVPPLGGGGARLACGVVK